jgi:hypothetical protein
MPKRKPPVAKKFVTPAQAFKAQVKVQFTRDCSGWVNRERGIKWHAAKHKVVTMDEEHAREFAVKGYVLILDGTVKPVSEGEAEEMLQSVSTINLGGLHG